MRHTSTHSYAILQVSSYVYQEIRQKLEQAGYGDQFHKEGDEELIDMHGIAIQADVQMSVGEKEIRKTVETLLADQRDKEPHKGPGLIIPPRFQ